MRTLTAHEETELSAILDYVHDTKFSLSTINHNARTQTLTIPIELRSTKRVPISSWLPFGTRHATTRGELLIKKALGFKVQDEARTGEGDINTIAKEGSKIVIRGNLPVSVVVDVEELEIELVMPEDAHLA